MTKWIAVVVTSLVFAAATYFASVLIRGNLSHYREGSPSHKAIVIAIISGALFLGLMFVQRKEINIAAGLLNTLPVRGLVLPSMSAGLLYVVWILLLRTAHRRLWETFLLTLVPGTCWFSRFAGAEETVLVSIGALLGSLAALGTENLRNTNEAEDVASSEPELGGEGNP